MLRQFWPSEKIKAWEKELFPDGLSEDGNDATSNLICLTQTLHNWWNRGVFALKPIALSEDKRTLKIQFFWQREVLDKQPKMSLLTEPPSTQGLDGVTAANGARAKFLNVHGRLAKSGDIFELTTDNPEIRPLPSFQLLEMQWFLQRVLGMAGAAEVDEDVLDEDSDDISRYSS